MAITVTTFSDFACGYPDYKDAIRKAEKEANDFLKRTGLSLKDVQVSSSSASPEGGGFYYSITIAYEQ